MFCRVLGLADFFDEIFSSKKAIVSRRILRAASRMEAWGFEPQSRDNVRGGLYMHSRWFNLDPGDEQSTSFAGIQSS